MKIKEIKESDELPFCPVCGVALKFEGRVYSDKQLEEHRSGGVTMIPKAKAMRCPKCYNLYRVDAGE